MGITVGAARFSLTFFSHGPAVNDFMTWCDSAFLQVNIKKTNDMEIDFRSSPSSSPQPTSVKWWNGPIVISTLGL